MSKQIKAYINRQAHGEYEYLTTIAFEHDESDCLRITKIRMRKPGEPKPFKMPLNLLSWYTEHAPAGREITREDITPQREALLYIELNKLKEQLETFSLKDHLLLEIEIKELDRNDEGRTRSDKGLIILDVSLYDGPRAGCDLALKPLHSRVDTKLAFPDHCSKGGRFDLAEVTLQTTEGPLDPLADKRVLIGNIEAANPYETLRPALVERLVLIRAEKAKPRLYVRDHHTYAETFASHPLDQQMPFPDGAAVFGPLLPQGPREKPRPFTLSLLAPLNDPFWQNYQAIASQNNHQPLHLKIELILPEPEANKIKTVEVSLTFDEKPCLVITDINARSAPVRFALEEGKETSAPGGKGEGGLTLNLETPLEGPPTSHLITVLHHDIRATEKAADPPEELMNLALTAKTGATASHNFKPDVLELARGAHQHILLTPTPEGIKHPPKEAQFKIKCFWPDQGRDLEQGLTVKWDAPLHRALFAIDIGVKEIAMAIKTAEAIEPLMLGRLFAGNFAGKQDQEVHAAFASRSDYTLIAQLQMTTAMNETDGEAGQTRATKISDNNYRAHDFPLSLSYDIGQTQNSTIENRLTQTGHLYDFSLSPTSQTIDQHSWADDEASQTAQEALDVPDTNQQDLKAEEVGKLPVRPLIAQGEVRSGLGKDDFVITRPESRRDKNGPKIALTRKIEAERLLTDCLFELISFHGTYLPLLDRAESWTVEEKNSAASIPDAATSLVLTHPDHLSQTARRRFLEAGAKALSRYEQGSFHNLGPAAELIGLFSPRAAQANIHLISNTTAGAYQALLDLAEREQPARVKKTAQIHLALAEETLSLGAFKGYIGETQARLVEQTGAINLPLGRDTLELMLVKEVASILETAMNAGAPIIEEAPLPMTKESFRLAANPTNEAEQIQQKFISQLRRAIVFDQSTKQENSTHGVSGRKRRKAKSSLVIEIAASQGNNWPFSLMQSITGEDAEVTLWQGYDDQKLCLIHDQETASWSLQLHCDLQLMCEKVGPLSTCLAFIGALLPRALKSTLPADQTDRELIITATLADRLDELLIDRLGQTADQLNARLLSQRDEQNEPSTARARGAAALVLFQKHPPVNVIRPNIVLVPARGELAAGDHIGAIRSAGDLYVISDHQAEGRLIPGTTSLQVIETISGLAALLAKDVDALSPRPYLEDLDRASKQQWANAEALWADWLSNCSQTMMNMPVPQNEQAEQGQPWAYQTLQENEARLSIGEHSYWISSGLSMREE